MGLKPKSAEDEALRHSQCRVSSSVIGSWPPEGPVILSLAVRVVDRFVCENCGDCAEIPLRRRREQSGLFSCFFPLGLNGLQTAAVFG